MFQVLFRSVDQNLQNQPISETDPTEPSRAGLDQNLMVVQTEGTAENINNPENTAEHAVSSEHIRTVSCRRASREICQSGDDPVTFTAKTSGFFTDAAAARTHARRKGGFGARGSACENSFSFTRAHTHARTQTLKTSQLTNIFCVVSPAAFVRRALQVRATRSDAEPMQRQHTPLCARTRTHTQV